jgi:alanyl-tRNA synthetase
MTIHELRAKYLEFFEGKKHAIIASASLLPENDPTTLFTGSGMQPMVPYLLGEKHPRGTRITDSQKCFRSQDIEEVGDNRHTTFFEMLGNWSLGDYYKKEQISWAFEFLIDELGLDPRKLFVTVFRGNDQVPRDTDTVELWKGVYAEKGIDAIDVDFSERDGMQGGQIFYYDESKNWWSRTGTPERMPVGELGGPDSELFWDFGEEKNLHNESEFSSLPCHVNCDCGRFSEIGNNVFMEYIKTETGFDPLSQQNVDFGGGLERIAAAMIDDPDIFNIGVFDEAKKIIHNLQTSASNTKTDRVILDHIRAATFLIADDATPSNKDQGYFTRRLIRRAVRFGKNIGIEKPFCAQVAQTYIDEYKNAYPELGESSKRILSEFSKEEDKFRKTLIKGEKEFEKMFQSKGNISGEDAFILYSTYGFPIELSKEMANEKGQVVDVDKFKTVFEKHKDLSRAGAKKKFAGGLEDHSQETVKLHTATHMLHQALKNVLGNHVVQKGSNITPKRLRFDFIHSEKMKDDEKKSVENLVNTEIQKKLSVVYEMLELNEAKEKGAIGVFDDKYAALGEKLKVYTIGGSKEDRVFSKEVCGGPHVQNTSELGKFKIIKEESVGSGVRRIKAILE